MSELGSLPNFLTISPEFNKTIDFLTPSRRSTHKNPKLKITEAVGQTRFRRDFSGMSQYDQGNENYIYTSVHKDLSTFMRLNSAAPTARSAEKQKIEKKVPKIVKSRISSRRDPSELQVPIPKSVKMQEKIRNELL